MDSETNSYITGSFQGSIRFGSINLVGSTNNHRLFVAKYDAAGTLAWATHAGGGVGNTFGWSVAVGPEDHVYVAGQFSGTTMFDNVQLDSAGSQDICIAKYDRMGTLVWAKQLGGVGDDFVTGLALDAVGNLYLVGHFSGRTAFGSIGLGSIGQRDLFVVKLDSTAKVLWAKRAGGPNMDLGNAIATDRDGNCYITGQFQENAQFEDVKLSTESGVDLFIAKLNSAGRFEWAVKATGPGDDQGRSISVAPDGNCYVTGHFRYSLQAGTLELEGTDTDHLFVAKLNPGGEFLWAKTVANGRSFGLGISTATDRVYLTGQLEGLGTFDGHRLVAQRWDMLVAQLDSNGNVRWANRAGGNDFEVGSGIAVNPAGEPHVTGVLLSTNANFGCGIISNRLGNDSVFVARLAGDSVFSEQPSSQSVEAGSRAEFQVRTSIAAERVQWLKNGIPLDGATAPTLVIDSVQLSDAGDYTATVALGTCRWASEPATLTVQRRPLILADIDSQLAEAGTDLLLTVSVAGSEPIEYTWIKDHTNQLAVTSLPSLTLTNATLEDSGFYSVRAENEFGSVISKPFEVRVQPAGAPIILAGGRILPRFRFHDMQSVQIELRSSLTNSTMFYTLDGSLPDSTSQLYTSPFEIDQSAVVRAIAYDSNFTSFLSSPVPVELLRTHRVTAMTRGGGTIILEPSEGPYPEGSIVRARAEPAPGWELLHWAKDASGTNIQIEVVADRTKEIEAVFGTVLTLKPSGRGSILSQPAAAKQRYGTAVTLTARPAPGHYFALWGGDRSGNTNPLSLIITNPQPTLSALFLPLPTGRVALTVIVSGSGTVLLQPESKLFAVGQPIVLEASAGGERRFRFWSGDVSGSENPISITLDQSKTVYAHFDDGELLHFGRTVLAPDGTVNSSVSGRPNIIRIEASSNLSHWNPIATLTNATGTAVFQIKPTLGSEFFRAIPE